jgi:uncharacterized protein (TIGR03084 family)
MADVAAICDDLHAEHAELDALVAPLPLEDWERPTPAAGWLVRDQITHLTYFDAMATMAITDPDRFAAERAEAFADEESVSDRQVAATRSLPPPSVLAQWRRGRETVLDTFRRADPSARVPWYGPEMSLASFVTARLMETWAHGQDVVDALGVTRVPTDRLRHIAHIGVRAFPNSFAANGMAVPSTPVRVELTAPSGGRWEWGEVGAVDTVRGQALDFGLVVTRRRHLDDTGLAVEGPVGEAWMSVAQAFAGPPGTGRRPGQFRQGAG